jgi:Acetyltransferase (GNAT) domain
LIQFVKHSELDKKKWDHCISQSPNGLIYAYSWYLDIVCKEWDGLVEDDYMSVTPLPKGVKYKLTYSYPPPYTQQLGLFSMSEISAKKTIDFLAHIPGEYQYIEMNLNECNPAELPDYIIKQGVTHLLSLHPPYDRIATGYATQIKRNLKKASGSSLTVLRQAAPEQVITLFRENRGKQHTVDTANYQLLNNLIATCLRKNTAEVWGVTTQNQLCAGVFFLKSDNRYIFLFSGVNETGYETNAMTFLIDSFIKEHSETDAILDFEGSTDANLARFYKGFGSERKEFPQLRLNRMPAPLKWIKELQYKRNTKK